MAILKINNFVGEAPSVSGRALGSQLARQNRNLFLPSGEFWPMATDKVHSQCANGTQTLYRLQRNADGKIVRDPAAPLLCFTERRSFVKGQINDEATERTYLTFEDGRAPPRVINAQGADRLLGVPRPRKPEVTVQVVDEFTPDEANNWLFGTMAADMKRLAFESVVHHTPDSQALIRYDSDGISWAGPLQNYGMVTASAVGSSEHGMLYAAVSNERVEAVLMQTLRLSGIHTGAQWLIPLKAMPLTYRIRPDVLRTSLAQLELPDTAGDKAGQAALSEEAIESFVSWVLSKTEPGTSVGKYRGELDSLAREFSELAMFSIWDVVGEPPVRPTMPEGGQWVGGDNESVIENPEWIAYEAALDSYYTAMDEYSNGVRTVNGKSNQLNARMLEIQQRCSALVSSIESVLGEQWVAVVEDSSGVSGWMEQQGATSDLVGDLVERVMESRFYVAAFVTDWGEESEPSPVSEMREVDQNDTVVIQRPDLMTGEIAEARHINRWRLYRSNTSATASAWQLVQEMDIGVASFLDDKKSEELDSLQPQFAWAGPPYRMDSQHESEIKPVVGDDPYLRGLVGMPNGIMAGFIDNTVAFCEPYVPYAWPVDYQITTEHPVVALAAFGQTLFVATLGNPYFISGASSASMSAIKLDSNQACIAARSVVAVQGGVLYASPDGICLATSAGVQVATRQHIAREDWVKLDAASMHAVEHEGVYYLFHAAGCITLDMQNGLKMGSIDLTGTAAWVDRFNDLLYVANGTDVLECFSGTDRRAGLWEGGIAVLERQQPLAWVKVYGEQRPDAPLTVTWHADGQLRHSAVFTDLKPQRLPPGRWLEHQVSLEGRARATCVLLCSTTEELRGV